MLIATLNHNLPELTDNLVDQRERDNYFNRPNYHIVENWYNVVDSVKDTNQTLVILKKK